MHLIGMYAIHLTAVISHTNSTSQVNIDGPRPPLLLHRRRNICLLPNHSSLDIHHHSLRLPVTWLHTTSTIISLSSIVTVRAPQGTINMVPRALPILPTTPPKRLPIPLELLLRNAFLGRAAPHHSHRAHARALRTRAFVLLRLLPRT